MGWQLKLDELVAEANVYANETARALIADSFDASGAAYAAATRWQLLQDEIGLHMNNAKGGKS